MERLNHKKGIMGPIVSVFVLVLIVSILSGLTFLFVASLKTQVIDTTRTATGSVVNETGWINNSGYRLAKYSELAFASPVISGVNNQTGLFIPAANYTLVGNVVYNATADTYLSANFSYTYKYISETGAYNAVNTTESAGSTVINYLSLIFLAVIFGAILTLVLKIILPYINLGKQFEGF